MGMAVDLISCSSLRHLILYSPREIVAELFNIFFFTSKDADNLYLAAFVDEILRSV